MSGDKPTLRNIEIKAKIRDFDTLLSNIQEFSQSQGEEIKQEDTFFNVNNGRLKLRKRQDYSVAELMFYDRPEVQGPKLSKYSKCKVQNGDDVLNILTLSMGVKGVVKKTRLLFIVDHTRIHIDNVEGLGRYVELEVSLAKDISIEDAQNIAKSTMETLGIDPNDVVLGSYLDLLHRPPSHTPFVPPEV